MLELKACHMKPRKKAAKTKSKRSKMSKLFLVDDEMKELSAMLEKEISDWPGVSKKAMFGFQGLYRDGVIFAALPRSRAMNSPRSIIFKFASLTPAILGSAKKDSRVDSVSSTPGSGWFAFELNEASATQGALGWLGRAYEAVKK
jgi:hypothetical protein